jgi:hypothetical protein
MIEIKADKSFYVDGRLAEFKEKSMHDFLISSLGIPVSVDENLTLGDLVHILYEIKDFIGLYTGEEYEVGRVLMTHSNLLDSQDYIKIFKNVEVDKKNNININVCSEFGLNKDSAGIKNVANLKIKFDYALRNGDDVMKDNKNINVNFTLLDIVSVLYEDLLYVLRNDNVLA